MRCRPTGLRGSWGRSCGGWFRGSPARRRGACGSSSGRVGTFRSTRCWRCCWRGRCVPGWSLEVRGDTGSGSGGRGVWRRRMRSRMSSTSPSIRVGRDRCSTWASIRWGRRSGFWFLFGAWVGGHDGGGGWVPQTGHRSLLRIEGICGSTWTSRPGWWVEWSLIRRVRLGRYDPATQTWNVPWSGPCWP